MESQRLSCLLVLCSLLPAGAVQGQTGEARPDYRCDRAALRRLLGEGNHHPGADSPRSREEG
jgi:hypothetical protein